MVRFGLNLPKDDCQVSSIFVWMNLSVCFTGEFLPKFDLFKGFKLCMCNPSKHTRVAVHVFPLQGFQAQI